MVRVGYLTVVFADTVGPQAARHLVDEIAGDIISWPSIEAVKCDVGELTGEAEIGFWEDAEASHPRESPQGE